VCVGNTHPPRHNQVKFHECNLALRVECGDHEHPAPKRVEYARRAVTTSRCAEAISPTLSKATKIS
jgi:hypothetical protein